MAWPVGTGTPPFAVAGLGGGAAGLSMSAPIALGGGLRDDLARRGDGRVLVGVRAAPAKNRGEREDCGEGEQAAHAANLP